VIVEVSKYQNTEISFNKSIINFPAVNKVISSLTKEKIKVDIVSVLPLGCGFGLSGASALAVSYALNKLLTLKKTNKQLAIVAHTADVESRSGLGDVTGQYYGGLLVRFEKSSRFLVQKLPFNNTPVYCVYFSKLSTKSILTDEKLKKNINKSATIALQKIKALLSQKKKIKFEDILKLSNEFAINSGLLRDKQTKETIAVIEKNNGHASMIMLGNAVMSDVPFEGSKMYTISEIPAHLV
jgi:pantoate kinase